MREADVGLRSTDTIKFYFKKAFQCGGDGYFGNAAGPDQVNQIVQRECTSVCGVSEC
jgi:hypothetical protein